MARFDVFAYRSAQVPLILDVQADLLSNLATRVVVPLVPESQAKGEALSRLKPVITVNGERYVLMTTDLAALKASDCGDLVAKITDPDRQVITDALDFLFQGF